MLEANGKRFLADIDNVSEAQWKFKPASDRWSVGDVSEHIALAEGLLFSIVQRTLQGAADEEKSKTLAGKEQQLLSVVTDRSSHKAQAPEVLKPTGKFSNKKELIQAFMTVREKTIHYIKTTQDPLKTHVAHHPTFGDMTTYQWLVFIAVHADRHVGQLEEVMRDSDFPKNSEEQ